MDDPSYDGVHESGSEVRRVQRQTTFTARVSVDPATFTQPYTNSGDSGALERESSNQSEDLQGLGRLSPNKIVLLRFECISARELKVCPSPMKNGSSWWIGLS
jgi:hypothetical protein